MKNWEENIRKVVPYVPGEQPKKQNIIKLNTNENPYPPAPGVAEAVKSVDIDRLRMYPDPLVTDLVEAIASNYQVKNEQVFVGVGSDDVLAMIFMTFFNSKKPILFPDITYSFYDVWADMLRIPYEQIPLDEDFKICLKDYSRENGGVIFPNPNAPTGELMDLAQIEEIIQANPDVIVVDPPRKGCDIDCLNTMLKMKPERIVYVSCDSATLARDVKALTENGYVLKSVTPVDQFCHTAHVETVCLLSRN